MINSTPSINSVLNIHSFNILYIRSHVTCSQRIVHLHIELHFITSEIIYPLKIRVNNLKHHGYLGGSAQIHKANV
jgi:hypothetical protein